MPETSMILSAMKSVLKTADFEKSLSESVKQRKLTYGCVMNSVDAWKI